MNPSLRDLRMDFPMLRKPLIYFDHAATSLTPSCVIDAMRDFYENHYATVHRAIYKNSVQATEMYQAAREKVRAFLHARSVQEIIFTRGTTAALNLLAHSFGETFIFPGDVILLTEIEHHSNLLPWLETAEKRGAQVKYIPVNDAGEISFDALDKLLRERVKLLSIAHVSNVLGTRHPIEEITRRAHKAGAFVAIDGAQSAGHLPLDVEAWDVDFFAFSGHKMYGPTGIGVLYGKQALLEEMLPLERGGDMALDVTLKEATFQPLPLKFEAGTPPIAEVIGLGRAIDYLNAIGLPAIYEHEQELLTYATEKLEPLVTILGKAKKKGPIINFVHKEVHPLDIAALLDEKNIAFRTGHHCAKPALTRFKQSVSSRISFGLYNTLEEIDFFVEALLSALHILK